MVTSVTPRWHTGGSDITTDAMLAENVQNSCTEEAEDVGRPKEASKRRKGGTSIAVVNAFC